MLPCDRLKGLIIINTPINPNITATILLLPTASPSKGTESIVINNGAIKNIAAVFAKGRTASAEKYDILTVTSSIPRNQCRNGFLVFKMCQPPSKFTKNKLKKMPITDLKKTIW